MNLVSIIIPVYNAEKYIKACIDSILSQTYNSLEVILVDDGSQDLSGKYCQEYAQKDKRVRYVYQENKGVSTARNNGITLARGNYIVFVDSDDIVQKDMISLLLSKGDVDFAMCGYELYDDKRDVITEHYICSPLSGEIRDLANNIDKYLNPPFLLGPCFKLFKKEIIVQQCLLFPPELSYGEDAVFVLDYLTYCSTVEIFDTIGYVYRKNGSTSLSSRFLYNKIDINYRINCLIKTLLEREKVEKRTKILSEKLLNNFVAYTQELICSKLSAGEKFKVFYERYSQYKNELGKPKHIPQWIVCLAGKCKIFYGFLYLFKIRNMM